MKACTVHLLIAVFCCVALAESQSISVLTLKSTYLSEVRDVCVSGNYAYVSDHGNILKTDISNPSSPQLIHS